MTGIARAIFFFIGVAFILHTCPLHTKTRLKYLEDIEAGAQFIISDRLGAVVSPNVNWSLVEAVLAIVGTAFQSCALSSKRFSLDLIRQYSKHLLFACHPLANL